jgi:hypothetical protein
MTWLDNGHIWQFKRFRPKTFHYISSCAIKVTHPQDNAKPIPSRQACTHSRKRWKIKITCVHLKIIVLCHFVNLFYQTSQKFQQGTMGEWLSYRSMNYVKSLQSFKRDVKPFDELISWQNYLAPKFWSFVKTKREWNNIFSLSLCSANRRIRVIKCK